MSSDLASWAEEIQEEVFGFWRSKYPRWKPGFQVWYGPVDESKSVLIVGLQPGGGEGDFENDRDRFEEGDFSLPEKHDYLTSDFDLARDTRKAVSDELIEQSVKTNINFFRDQSDLNWTSGLDGESRREIEEFSFVRVDELVNRLNPDIIITEGMGVYDEIYSAWEVETETVERHQVGDNGKERLYCVGKSEEYTIVGLKHPSAGHGIREEDYSKMKKTVTAVWDGTTDLC